MQKVEGSNPFSRFPFLSQKLALQVIHPDDIGPLFRTNPLEIGLM
jgi:hypothetical protein